MNEIIIVVLGGEGVGKSTIIVQYLFNRFVDNYEPTIEDNYTKNIIIDGTRYDVKIVDTAGQEEYSYIRDLHLATADGFLLVYDITESQSYFYINEIIERIQEKRPKERKIPMVICGNKSELEYKRGVVLSVRGDKLSEHTKCPFYECSAKNHKKINEMWEDLIRRVIAKKFIRKKKSCIIM
jgi:small GTP-binding protein